VSVRRGGGEFEFTLATGPNADLDAENIVIGLVLFDSAAVVAGRLGIVRGAKEHTRIITLETLGRLASA
jgi:hypothetical protein